MHAHTHTQKKKNLKRHLDILLYKTFSFHKVGRKKDEQGN